MQRILEGLESLPALVRAMGCRKPLMVIDTSYPFLSIRDSIESLEMSGIKFGDFTPNPLYEQVCKGIDLCLSEGCDSIMAVGGGSAIDVAKCIKLAVISTTGKESLIPPMVSQKAELKDGPRLPLIAIPTTAGTGSESTHNAVIYYEGAKQTVTDDTILPDVAILEHHVLKTLPLYQKKCTMMDALCQGIESWWSVNSTDESKEYSQKAVELIMTNWRNYIFENEEDAARQIMIAANYSGRAINIAQTTAAHAMSYKITSMYKLSHGHAVAVCLPEIWDYMLANPDRCIDSRGRQYLSRVFESISSAMGCDDVEEAIHVFRGMMNTLDLDNPKRETGQEGLFEELCKSVNPVRLKNNPIVLDSEAIASVYSTILR